MDRQCLGVREKRKCAYLLAFAILALVSGVSTRTAHAQTNTSFGTSALSSNTTGVFNGAFGINALRNNTTGNDNTADGILALVNNLTGNDNTATGFQSLYSDTTGSANTGEGSFALFNNTTGYFNTATGYQSLQNNIGGFENTAIGVDALFDNQDGNYNTAVGANALITNSSGNYNTATGLGALYSNTSGRENTATGVSALIDNTTGVENTADGTNALFGNTTGSFNTATGEYSLSNNTTGSENTANGVDALHNNTTGNANTAVGEGTLFCNTTGVGNIAIGIEEGCNIVAGSDNIYIGASGITDESNTIRIGDPATQTATFIAGISGTTVTGGAAVVVNSSGQLGVASSSIRYKRDIHNMGDSSDKLMQLRPVTFRYKSDPSGIQQYGLIAEEVAKVYPDLVVNDRDGKPQTVAYQTLPAMLLNEVQKQAKVDRELVRENKDLRREVDLQKEQLATMQRTNLAIDARLDSLEQQARASRPERLAASIH